MMVTLVLVFCSVILNLVRSRVQSIKKYSDLSMVTSPVTHTCMPIGSNTSTVVKLKSDPVDIEIVKKWH